MITLSFTYNNEVLNFAVHEREIWYKDRIWKGGVRCIPRDEKFFMKIIMGRNKLPSSLLNMFNLSEEDIKEYQACKTDEELANVIIKDCKKKGLKLISRNGINVQ